MKNLFYYLNKNGNRSFDDFKFNEVDALLLSQISYLFFERIINDLNKSYRLKELMVDKNSFDLAYEAMNYKNNLKLIKIFKNTSRYDDIYFSDVVSNFDSVKKRQFYAMTFWLDDYIFIAFRGTDLSMAGWREDFNMWFLKSTPGQIDALDYTTNIYNKYHKNMILSGHSKGGNLAFYSAIYSSSDIKDKILKVYSFDGPGLKDSEPYSSPEYNMIKDRCFTYSSRFSIVAVLLYHVEKIIYLKSRGFTILQHSAYNWYVSNDELTRIKNSRLLSRFLDRGLTKYLSVSTDNERKRLVEILFIIAEENPSSSLLDIKNHPFNYISNTIHRKRLLRPSQDRFLKLELKKIRLCFIDVYKTRRIEKKKRRAMKLLLSKKK